VWEVSEYNLDVLGWFQFERLCQSLLKARCGLDVEAWGLRSDWGRDAYSEEALRFPHDEENPGPFIFQVKFVEKANGAGAEPLPALIAGVRSELRRIEQRREAGDWEEPRYYVLLTNTPLEAKQRTEVAAILEEKLPRSRITIQASSDLDALLDGSPAVRLGYPQILGVRDIFALLGKQVNKEIVERSTQVLQIATDRAPSFVATTAYTDALNKLRARHFVVLTGPPEMGKTTIAWMIALARLSGGWEAYECRKPGELFAVLDPERPQIFVADDAFGSTEYRPDRAELWAEDLGKVLRVLDNRHWLLLTSRPAPLKQALERLNVQDTGGEFPRPNEVIVNASALSVQEKAQMLYRHAKASVPSEEGRALIRGVAWTLVGNKHFTPLRIRRFVTERMPEILEAPEDEQFELIKATAAASIELTTTEMRTSFATLEELPQVLLISLLDAGSSRVDAEQLAAGFERQLGRPPERSALATAEMIEDHFLRIQRLEIPDGEAQVSIEWVHPSVRDVVIEHLSRDPAARRAFLSRAGLDGLMLALSSEGGNEGERLFPLLLEPDDWARATARLADLPGALTPKSDLSRLASLLADTARLAGEPEGAAHEAELKALTRGGLEALAAEWDRRREPLTNPELRSFYVASASCLPPLPGPDLLPSWQADLDAVDKTIEDVYYEPLLSLADEWLTLVALMRIYEPRWLKGLDFPAAYSERLGAIADRTADARDGLERPQVADRDEPGEYEEAPPWLGWVDTAERIARSLAVFEPELRERVESIPGQLEEIADEWHDYEELHDAYGEPDQDHLYDRDDGEEPEAFDLQEFFTDL
jgi:hypothetical protein